MRNNNLIYDFYQSQKEFGYLQSINLTRDIDGDGCSDYSINIDLVGFNENQKLTINFWGARNIKIGNLEGLLKLLITIADDTESQMEGIKYRVIEDENDLFSFYCKKIEFKIRS